MPGLRSLSDGHIKLTLLTTEPANIWSPTATELNAGIDVSCRVLASDFTWSPTDSAKVNEQALCDENASNSVSASNFQTGITLWRYFDSITGIADPTSDAAYTALKTKGTLIYGYARETGKLSTAAWASTDEIFMGGSVQTDNPQRLGQGGGYIKRRIPMEPQSMRTNLVVG